MAEYSVMDRINMIISDPDHATMTLAQIVTEEIREFKASEQYANMIQAEAYYRNRTDVQRKTNDVANRSNTRIEHPILKKLVDQKANYLLGKPFTVDTKNSSYFRTRTSAFPTKTAWPKVPCGPTSIPRRAASATPRRKPSASPPTLIPACPLLNIGGGG